MINQTITAVLFLIASTQFALIFGEISLTQRAQLNFTVNLLKEIAKDSKSAILSPFSISTALFMVYLAADGGTKQELLKFLGETASETEVRMHFDKLIAEIYRRKNENYVLHLANRCYVREGFSTKQGFSNMLQFYYGDTLHYFHYNQRYQLAQDVNNWVSDNTNHKITQLLTPGSINENTQMLLLNAIYFSGTWETQFNDEKTRNATFYVSENETKNVSMMILKEEFSYYEDDSVQVLKLPYIGNEVEMVFILPKIRFGLSNVLENLGVEQLLTYISVTEPDDVLINLPKFQVQGDLDLKETLQKIGLMNAFSEGANFKELTDLAISVSKIMHKGFIKVNEKGTESAAAIAVNFDFRSLAPSKKFIADQPFLFAIVRNSNTILFAGQFGK
ncbi:Serpin [Dirofilaria immitis]